MSPLGLPMTTVGAIGGPGMLGDPGGTVGPVAHYYMWVCISGSLQPVSDGTVNSVVDNNDMWDLVGNVSGYTPQLASTHAAEGYWEPDGSNDIQPTTVCS